MNAPYWRAGPRLALRLVPVLNFIAGDTMGHDQLVGHAYYSPATRAPVCDYQDDWFEVSERGVVVTTEDDNNYDDDDDGSNDVDDDVGEMMETDIDKGLKIEQM